MKPITYFFITIIFLNFTACSDIDNLQDDPNRVIEGQPSLLLTHLEINAFTQNVSLSAALANRQMTYVDGADSYQYYTWQRGSFSEYDAIKQACLLEEAANRLGKTAYLPISTFFKSYYISNLTKRFGNVPFLEAVQLNDGVDKPVYNNQKEIFLTILTDLKEASNQLALENEILSGDVVYQGDLLKWRKLINSFYLRVLMDLSKKSDDADLDIVNRFREVVQHPAKYPIFQTIEDQAAIEYVNAVDNRYPLFNSNSLQTAYYMEQTFVERLKSLQDPRLFTIAEQTPNSIAQGMVVTDFEAYGGLLGSAPFSELAIPATEGNASRIHNRYYNNSTNEPGILMSYAELQFILAEATSRGWISGNTASYYYEEGIKASMRHFGITNETQINSYVNQPSVALTSENGIEKIAIQKHISMFLNSSWQIYFEQRRTGYPLYDNAGGGIGNGGAIPKRFLYPESEINNNKVNLEEAITSQFANGDTVNGVMWLIK